MKRLWQYGLIIFVGVLCGKTQGTYANAELINGLIAFVSNRDENFEIYVVESDGSHLHNLTDNAASDIYPAWSPDGTKILFVSDRDNGNYDLFVMEANGSNPRNLTNSVASELFPAWSPDGLQITFVLYSDNESDIYILDSDGTDIRQLTDSGAVKIQPTWSPNGDQIAFSSLNIENTYYDVHIINSDGSELRNINEGAINGFPVWSPDGRYVAFALDPNPSIETYASDIFLLDVSSSKLHQITHPEVRNWFTPVWSPDGQFLAAFAYKSGAIDLYIYSIDETNIQQITTDALYDVPVEFTLDSPLITWQAVSR